MWRFEDWRGPWTKECRHLLESTEVKGQMLFWCFQKEHSPANIWVLAHGTSDIQNYNRSICVVSSHNLCSNLWWQQQELIGTCLMVWWLLASSNFFFFLLFSGRCFPSTNILPISDFRASACRWIQTGTNGRRVRFEKTSGKVGTLNWFPE